MIVYLHHTYDLVIVILNIYTSKFILMDYIKKIKEQKFFF